MGAVLALSAWLGLEALQGGPSIAGRLLDAQTEEPVARTTGSMCAFTRSSCSDGASSRFREKCSTCSTARTSTTSSRRSSRSRRPANTPAVCGEGSSSRRPSVCRCNSD